MLYCLSFKTFHILLLCYIIVNCYRTYISMCRLYRETRERERKRECDQVNAERTEEVNNWRVRLSEQRRGTQCHTPPLHGQAYSFVLSLAVFWVCGMIAELNRQASSRPGDPKLLTSPGQEVCCMPI